MAGTIEQNFRAAIGEDRTLTFTVTDSAGVAVDITNATINWIMKTHPLSATAVLTITGTNNGGAAGTFDVVITDALTDAIEPRVYSHDAKVTASGGGETVVALGSADFYAVGT